MKLSQGYVESFDGTRISWQASPKRPGPAIICCNGIGVSTFFWRYIRSYFEPDWQIITWDYRGHGKSEPPRDMSALGIADHARDAHAVLREVGIDKAIFVGHSMGVQVAYEMYRQESKRCAGLIPMLGSYGKPLSTAAIDFVPDNSIEKILAMIERNPERARLILSNILRFELAFPVAKRTFLQQGMASAHDMRDYFSHLRQRDFKLMAGMLRQLNRHSAEDLLPDINVPTLIVAAENDSLTPLSLSEKMHRLIPDSEMLVIPKGSHAALVEQPELINLRVEKFLQERIQRARRGS